MASTSSVSQPPVNALHQQRWAGTPFARLPRSAAPHCQPLQCRLQRRALENVNEAKDPWLIPEVESSVL